MIKVWRHCSYEMHPDAYLHDCCTSVGTERQVIGLEETWAKAMTTVCPASF